MPKKLDPELKARAVRLVIEHRAEYPTRTAAVLAVAKQTGVGKESLRRWVAQAEIDAGEAPGSPARRTRKSGGCGRRTVGCGRTIEFGPENDGKVRGLRLLGDRLFAVTLHDQLRFYQVDRPATPSPDLTIGAPVEVPVGDPVTVSGVLTDQGAPIPGATVTVRPEGVEQPLGSPTTGADGRLRFCWSRPFSVYGAGYLFGLVCRIGALTSSHPL